MNFGCQQNEADSEKLLGIAESMGYTYTPEPKDADLILVNTCAVREHAELKALSIIGGYKHIKGKNKDLIIGVCGCMTAQEHRVTELKMRYPYVDFTLQPAQLPEMPMILLSVLEKKKRHLIFKDINLSSTPIVEGLPVTRSVSHRAWVSIMNGCNNFCSYCIVPYVRGRERSRSSKAIYAEVLDLVSSGCRDITLLGQNVNSYQSDCTFAELMAKLDAIEGDFILRFMTSHPKDVPDELIAVMAKAKHIAPHFHLPVQSGSDSILKAMNRKYDTKRYLSVVEKLRQAIPNISLTADIIVGFPGETEEDFQQTLSMIENVRFDMLYAFIYSKRKGTPASLMENQIDPAVKSERLTKLIDKQNAIAYAHNQAYLGKTVRILVDGVSKNEDSVYSGRTADYHLVHFSASKALIGEFVTVKIERAETFALFGAIVS